MIQNLEGFYTELNELGEEQVKTRLAQGIYSEEKKPLIKNWLIQKKEIEESKIKNKEIQIAKSAKNAAWVANGIALISLVISFIALYFSLKKI